MSQPFGCRGFACGGGEAPARSAPGHFIEGRPPFEDRPASISMSSRMCDRFRDSRKNLIIGAMADPTTEPRPVEKRIRCAAQAISSTASALSAMLGKPKPRPRRRARRPGGTDRRAGEIARFEQARHGRLPLLA